MRARSMVLRLAKERVVTDSANWIVGADTETNGRLVFQGADIIKKDTDIEVNTNDLARLVAEKVSSTPIIENDADNVRRTMPDLVANLGTQVTLTIADISPVEHMGVLHGLSPRDIIYAERRALVRRLGQVSSLWLHLEEPMSDVRYGIGSLRKLIDPEDT